MWLHLIIASLFNIVGFSVFSSFAQLAGATSRVAIVAYTMPIWSLLLAWTFLGERPNRPQSVALGLCAAGLTILIYPLAEVGIPLGIVYALATGISWAAGTVYLKWAKIKADPLGVASWQLTIAFVVITVIMFAAEGRPDLHRLQMGGIGSILWTGVIGNGVAYALWFTIVRRLPAMTASLGILGSPVIGVVASIIILGEVPSITDIIGFALIFASSVCVLFGGSPAPEPTP